MVLLFGSDLFKITASESDEQERDFFELKVFSDKQIYKTTDKIHIWTTLKYVGTNQSIKIWHAGPRIMFYISDGKDINIGGAKFLVDWRYTILRRNKVYAYNARNLSVDGNDPLVAYWETHNSGISLNLPEGEYEIKAVGDFSLSKNYRNKVDLSDKISIKVEK